MKRGLKHWLYHVGTNPTFKAFILIYQKEKEKQNKTLLNQGSFPAFISKGNLLKVFQTVLPSVFKSRSNQYAIISI